MAQRPVLWLWTQKDRQRTGYWQIKRLQKVKRHHFPCHYRLRWLHIDCHERESCCMCFVQLSNLIKTTFIAFGYIIIVQFLSNDTVRLPKDSFVHSESDSTLSNFTFSLVFWLIYLYFVYLCINNVQACGQNFTIHPSLVIRAYSCFSPPH